MTEGTTVKELYGGKIRVKYVDTDKQHAYYVSKKIGKEWTPYERATGVTTFIGIKDKSVPLKFWTARIMFKFLLDILVVAKREITKFDLVEVRGLHTKRLEEAATIGDKIHDWIEDYVKGNNPGMPQEPVVLQGVNAFLDLEKKQGWKWVEAEMMVYHESSLCPICKKNGIKSGNEYVGRLDLLAKAGKKLILPDVKTSNGIYNDVMLQTGAYAHAVEAMGYGKVGERWELRLEKRTKEEFELEMDEKGKVNETYRPFEALQLPGSLEDDFEAFLHFKAGYDWNKNAERILKAAIVANSK